MAGHGPAPKPPARRARRNKPPVPERVIETDVSVPQPKLPKLPHVRWHAVTLRWWDHVGRLFENVPMAATDWDELLILARIFEQVMGCGDLKMSPELRLRAAKWGLTPEDRARLRITFAGADKAQQDQERRRSLGDGARGRFGPLMDGGGK